MALQEHATLRVFVNQTYLVELTSITFRTESGQIRVETMEGLAGFTPGSGVCTVALGLAVPIGGQEFPFQQSCADGDLVDIQIPIGQEGSYAGRGKIMDVEFSGSVNANTEESVNWEGELKTIE